MTYCPFCGSDARRLTETDLVCTYCIEEWVEEPCEISSPCESPEDVDKPGSEEV